MISPFACPNVLRDCECIPFPARNFSVEEIDVPVCFAHFTQPATAGTFFEPECFKECTGVVTTSISECETVTQQCAEREAIDCSFDPPVPPSGDPDNPNPPLGRTLFNNAPAECTVECPDGSTTTEFVDAGTIRTPWQADADARARALACKLARRHQICFTTASPLASVCVNEVMSIVFDVAGGRAPYVFTVDSGSLPLGLELNPEGNLFGTPQVQGLSSFDIRVTDDNGAFQIKSFTIRVIEITSPSTLPAGTTGVAYSYTLLESGAATPLWTLAAGALPAGLTLNSISGEISGTPTTAGTSNFTLTLLDAGNGICSKDFSLQIAQAVGLVGYWSYDSYGVGPNRVLDSTANAHNLEILFAFTVVAGKVGNCMSTFQNTCEATSSLSDFNYVAANGFTICGWTKFDFDQEGTITIWEVDYGVNFITLEFNTDSLHMFTGGGEEVFATYPADGNWHFFRSWIDTNKILNIQIDNGTIFQSNDPIAYGDLTCTHFQLQGPTTAIPDTKNGFDETAFWKRVLSNSESSALWNGGSGTTYPTVPP